MSYSIQPVMHLHADKHGKHKVNIRLTFRRKLAYAPTIVKINERNWHDGLVVKHLQANSYNSSIKRQLNEIEGRLLEALKHKSDLSKEELNNIVKGHVDKNDLIETFIDTIVKEYKGKISEGRIKHYSTLQMKLNKYSPGLTFSKINVAFLQTFEAWRRSQPGRNTATLDRNTMNSNMSLFKSVLNKAAAHNLIKKEAFEAYKVPSYKQKLPEYINQDEMAKLFNLLQNIEKKSHKIAGYYYLLGCYCGYRISDMKRFNYDEMVRDGRLRLRAKKNGEIVSILIHSRLSVVLEWVRSQPLDIYEQDMREHVKELMSLIGVSRNITIHSSRHSFGMLLAESGFSLEEAAELLGDSQNVARVYFRMTNKRLDAKVKDRLG